MAHFLCKLHTLQKTEMKIDNTYWYEMVSNLKVVIIRCPYATMTKKKLGYSNFLHQWNWQLQYNWDIVESGVKHNNPNPIYV